MSQDPYTSYSNQPQNPYPYGTSQNSYGAPPNPNPTSAPYGYGQQQEQSYEYTSPQAAPLPLEQAVLELPNQYLKVLTNPSASTFAQEMGKASWNIVWVQLIGYALISAIVSYVTSLILPSPFSTMDPIANPIVALLVQWGFTLGLVPLVIISFFVGNGILYLIAKAFRGQGTFLAQGYTNLLLAVPLGIISALVSRVPLFGALVAFGVLIYTIILRIYSIMAVHRLSGGKATAVVLIPIAGSMLLVLLLVVAIIAMVLGTGIH